MSKKDIILSRIINQQKLINMSVKKTKKRKTNRKSKKPKVYIPAYKIIFLCSLIILICMGLLLFTTVKEPDTPSLSQRFEDKKTESTATSTATSTVTSTVTTEKTSHTEENTPKKTAQTEKTTIKEDKVSVKKENTSSSSVKTSASNSEGTKKAAPASTVKTFKYNFPQAKNGAQLVFVFDDGGQNLNHLEEFLELPFPITIAVLPQLSHSVESAKQIRASGNELILHQPMQSINANTNPGPGAISPDMSESQIIATLFTNINEIGPIAGMNNHEGSAITADAEKMAIVMKVASENGIYFLDSRTNSETKVPYVAKELGYSYYERNIFLDNEKTNENARKELEKGLAIANKNGSVIMIGHIWSADFLPAFLKDVYPELKEKGYTFTTVSKSKALKR
ncbi:MAG: divergent polysaccharide deacetylase family protein [Treponema sp.]|nr:divergent polysaccharide deacetylase family protein [Treponema sp.]